MPDNTTVSYTYDANNRLSRLASFLGDFTFSYDALGNRTGFAYPNGVTTSHGYDPAGRLVAIQAQSSRGIVNAFNYTHDPVGNRLSRAEQQKESSSRYDYAYDATYQLLQALPLVPSDTEDDAQGRRNMQAPAVTAPRTQNLSDGEREHEKNHGAENYVYGAVGNRLRGPGRGDASVYNELNQLIASTTEEFRYDANGNLIYRAGLLADDEDDYEQQSWSYEYDLENRLVKATKIGEQGEYAFIHS